jgi:hypothetical protein
MIKAWKRFTCWLKGHRPVEVRFDEEGEVGGWYRSCTRCGAGDRVHELFYGATDNLWERFSEAHEILATLTAVIVIGAAISLGIGLIVGVPTVTAAWYTCKVNGTIMELPWQYNIWGGCFYHIDGRWITDELLNVVDLLK